MKTMFQKMAAGLAVAAMLPVGAAAQDKVEASVGADLVSSYIWRGQELGGVSFQPTLSVAWKGLSLTAWGSVGWESEFAKEFDLTLGYSIKGFSVSVTDYSFSSGKNFKTGADINGKYFHFGSWSTLHVFEAQVGYDFGFLAVNWFTNIGGNDGLKSNGKRAYLEARKGNIIDMPERKITVYSADLLSYENNIALCRFHVSKGTYIRSLARDIAYKANSAAHLINLRRETVLQ